MNILIVRIGRMGDMVMILPAIQAIRERHPEATLYALTSRDGMRVLPFAGIDSEHMCDYRGQWWFRLAETLKVKRWVAAHHFDEIYCFEMKQRTVGWLPHSAQVLQSQASIQHYADRCLQLVLRQRTLALIPQPYLPLPVTQEDVVLRAYGVTPHTIVIGFHPTYSGFGKWGKQNQHKHRLWPESSFAALALQLTAHARQQGLDLKIVMSLLPDEQAFGQRLVARSQGSIVVLPGTPEFKAYLAYLQRLNVLVVSNTGVLHLAAALNTPVVALFSRHNPEDCGPYMAKGRYVVLRAEAMENPELGLEAISVDNVLSATLRLLKETSHG